MHQQSSYDYIIIGAGSAGCVIANRLSEMPGVSVLIIDAGGSDKSFLFRRPGALAIVYQVPELKERSDWGYRTTPQPHMDMREMPWTRGKVLGGCSSVNGMLYVRGHRDNYDQWRDMGNPGWGYEDVLPYFKKSEGHEDGDSEFHGADGPLKVTHQQGTSVISEAFNEAVSQVCDVPIVDDFNGPRQEGAGFYQMTCADRKRSSTSVAFLYPAAQRGGLEIVSQATVSRVVIENQRAVGVEYTGPGGETFCARADREVILSAGAIGSPQIMMLSGVGPADHLREHGIKVVEDLPGVGQNLHDHLMVPIRYHATKDSGHTSTALHFIAGMMKDFFLNEGWYGKTFLEGGAFVKSSPLQPRPDIQFLTIPWAYPEPNDDGPEKPVIATTHSFTVLPGVIYPKSRGAITLQSSDPMVHPLIDPHYFENDDDLKTLLKGVELTRAFAKTAPLNQYLKSEAVPGEHVTSEAGLRAHIRLFAKTIYHPVGTCKMGPDASAVVDHELRVHGIEGLRIADASIMPTITGGNTNAPSIMIGEKAADMIQRAASQGDLPSAAPRRAG